MKTEIMHGILVIAAIIVLLSFWKSHRDPNNSFNLFDLIIDNGRLSKVSVGYMLVLGVSTWVVVNQEVHGRLSDGTFGLWLTAWVAPLLAQIAKSGIKPEEPKT